MHGNSDTIYFVSDLHFGENNPGLHPDREKIFRQFLRSITHSCTKLFILGDLFDFWMEYKYYVPKNHMKTIFEIQKLKQNGTEIHYFSGNHDFNPGSFFSSQFGWYVYRSKKEFILQGKKTLMFHGDGVLPSDGSYRIMKKIILHPLSNWFFQQLHPDWGMSLAKWVAKTSRKRGTIHRDKIAKYRKLCRNLLNEKYDIVFYGHTHTSQNETYPDGQIINIGEWYKKLQYVKMQNGIATSKTYHPDRNNND